MEFKGERYTKAYLQCEHNSQLNGTKVRKDRTGGRRWNNIVTYNIDLGKWGVGGGEESDAIQMGQERVLVNQGITLVLESAYVCV